MYYQTFQSSQAYHIRQARKVYRRLLDRRGLPCLSPIPRIRRWGF